MKAKSLPVHFLVASSIMASALFSAPAFAANRCEALFNEKAAALLEIKMGVRETGKAHAPIGLQIVDSRYKVVADAINNLATWIFGKKVRLDAINPVIKKFLEDKTEDPYFVRIARAFDLRYTLDEAVITKNVPATGPAIVVLNHPRNGSDGIAVAAALSKIRPDTKIAMTLFLENVPGLKDNAVFLNPYGGPVARAYNESRMLEMQEHLKQGGLVVIFASGEVSMKDPTSDLLPVDKEWKTGAARLVQAVPEAQVIPVYVGGQATKEYYQVASKGYGIKTTLFHVRELANNIGRDFPLSFASPLAGKDLIADFGKNIKGMMKYLRARTYLMNEQSNLKAKVESEKRQLEAIAAAADPAVIHADIAKTGTLVFADPKKAINVYAVDGAKMSEQVWHDLGVAREKSFRVVGEGSGKSMDIDPYDRYYTHIIAVDTNTNKMLGAYRVGRVDRIVADKGIEGLYSYRFFDHSALIAQRGSQMLELGRSFVDFEAGSKAIVALDRLWKGVTGFINLHPHYRYMIGPVSISNAYSTTSKLLMLQYLGKNMEPTLAPLTHGRTPIEFTSQFKPEIDIVAEKTPDLKELNKIVTALDGQSIPPLLISYGKLGAKYLAFDRDKEFNTVDGLIVVDLLSKEANEEASKHFGENWEAYLKANGMTQD
jgi:putative hemolysin